MEKERRPYEGGFIKSKQYSIYQDLLQNSQNVVYDEVLAQKAETDIQSILGVKNNYSIFEAAEYFMIKYNAHRIPWKYMLQYCIPPAFLNDAFKNAYVMLSEATLNRDEILPFQFSEEINMTFAIDTYYNKTLREKYPNIAKTEEFIRKQNELGDSIAFTTNPIIVIGTKDNYAIDSMMRLYGYSNEYDEIPELEYELGFFHEHS